LKSHQKLREALLRQQKRINIGHTGVVYLVSPNILNKTFLTSIFS